MWWIIKNGGKEEMFICTALVITLFILLFIVFFIEIMRSIKTMGINNKLTKIAILLLCIMGAISSILILRMFQYSQQGLF